MPRGGKRPGAGLPKGYKFQKTLEKEAARQHLRKRVFAEIDPILDAQIANAKGINHFFLRDAKSGRFERITDPAMIEAALNAGEEGRYYWIFTKDPNTQAAQDLLNRALDKPADQVQVTGEDGGPVVHVFRWQQ